MHKITIRVFFLFFVSVTFANTVHKDQDAKISFFNKFLKCTDTSCSKRYLSSNISSGVLKKYSAWPFMNPEILTVEACSSAKSDPLPNTSICFQIKVDKYIRKGEVLFDKENGKLKIYKIRY